MQNDWDSDDPLTPMTQHPLWVGHWSCCPDGNPITTGQVVSIHGRFGPEPLAIEHLSSVSYGFTAGSWLGSDVSVWGFDGQRQ